MARRVSVKDARANFSELLRIVFYNKEPVIIERKGKPFAVMISPEQYESLKREEDVDWALLDQLAERNADKDPDEVLRDVTAVVEEVRQERYAKRQRAEATKGGS